MLLKLGCLKIQSSRDILALSGANGEAQRPPDGVWAQHTYFRVELLVPTWQEYGWTQVIHWTVKSLQFGKERLGAFGVTLPSGKALAIFFQLRL